MTDRTASPGRAVERAKSARRGGPSGRQAVGEYVGQPAGDAAQAVRRAGLRPGLDRSFGCAEELIGLVVAQEPAAGSSMARNGMVTLYVAAPGSEPMDEGTDAAQVESGGPEPAALAPVEAEQAEAASAPARVRRRKRGRARRAAPAVDAPPAPAPADRASASRAATVVLAQPAVEPPSEWQPEPGAGWRAARRRSARGARRGRGSRTTSSWCMWRMCWPGAAARRGGAGVSAPARGPRAGRWPRCSCMVARASAGGQRCRRGDRSVGDRRLRFCAGRPALAHPGSRARSRAASGPPRGIGRRRRSERLRPARGRCARAPRYPARTAQPRPVLRARRRRPAAAPVRETVAPPVAPVGEAPVPQAPTAAAPAPPAAAPPASAPPAAAPEQTRGGLFSP